MTWKRPWSRFFKHGFIYKTDVFLLFYPLSSGRFLTSGSGWYRWYHYALIFWERHNSWCKVWAKSPVFKNHIRSKSVLQCVTTFLMDKVSDFGSGNWGFESLHLVKMSFISTNTANKKCNDSMTPKHKLWWLSPNTCRLPFDRLQSLSDWLPTSCSNSWYNAEMLCNERLDSTGCIV